MRGAQVAPDGFELLAVFKAYDVVGLHRLPRRDGRGAGFLDDHLSARR
jgi:hypothetical protein